MLRPYQVDELDDDDLLAGVSDDLFGGADNLDDFLEDVEEGDGGATGGGEDDIDMAGFGFNTGTFKGEDVEAFGGFNG